MRFGVMCVAVLAALVAISVATAKPWYWSEEKAEAMAATKVHINYCLVFDPTNSDPKCADPVTRKHQGFYGLNEVTCTGADERGDTFTYARFKCQFVAGVRLYDYAAGRLVIYPTGAKTMRWRLTSLFRTR